MIIKKDLLNIQTRTRTAGKFLTCFRIGDQMMDGICQCFLSSPPCSLPLGTLRYPGRGGKENGESLERGRRHLRGKNKLRLSRLG